MWFLFYFFFPVILFIISHIATEVLTYSESIHIPFPELCGHRRGEEGGCFDEKIKVLPVKIRAGVPFAVNTAGDFDGYSQLFDGGGWYEHKRIDYKTGAGLEVVSN